MSYESSILNNAVNDVKSGLAAARAQSVPGTLKGLRDIGTPAALDVHEDMIALLLSPELGADQLIAEMSAKVVQLQGTGSPPPTSGYVTDAKLRGFTDTPTVPLDKGYAELFGRDDRVLDEPHDGAFPRFGGSPYEWRSTPTRFALSYVKRIVDGQARFYFTGVGLRPIVTNLHYAELTCAFLGLPDFVSRLALINDEMDALSVRVREVGGGQASMPPLQQVAKLKAAFDSGGYVQVRFCDNMLTLKMQLPGTTFSAFAAQFLLPPA